MTIRDTSVSLRRHIADMMLLVTQLGVKMVRLHRGALVSLCLGHEVK